MDFLFQKEFLWDFKKKKEENHDKSLKSEIICIRDMEELTGLYGQKNAYHWKRASQKQICHWLATDLVKNKK